MNCAAILFEQHGEAWPSWLTERFLGISVDGGRELKPLSPADMISTLYALLASDRADHPRPFESVALLGRIIGIAEYADLQLAVIRCVMTAFGVPGKFVDDVLAAVDARPRSATARLAPGTGAPSAPSPKGLGDLAPDERDRQLQAGRHHAGEAAGAQRATDARDEDHRSGTGNEDAGE
jgi:hypothetical protein